MDSTVFDESAKTNIHGVDSKTEKQTIFDQLVSDIKSQNDGQIPDEVLPDLLQLAEINGLKFEYKLKEKLSVMDRPDPTSVLSQDVFQIRTILSKTLFVDVENEDYSVYIPNETTKLTPVSIDARPIQTYHPKALMYKDTAILPSNRDEISDRYGTDEILFDSHMFNDISQAQIRDFDTYILDKSIQIQNTLPNLEFISSLEKEVNPFNIHNTLCLNFGQKEYYNIIADRTNLSFQQRRHSVQFDNVVVDGVARTARVSLRLHPFDSQLLDIVRFNVIQDQPLADTLMEYQLVAADGFVATPKFRVDRDARLIADVRSPVMARLCELSPFFHRTRILSSMTDFTPLWKVNVFSSSIDNAKDAIYRMAEISFTVADATTSALASVNVASAQQTLLTLLNLSLFRFEIDPTGSQSNFGSAVSAALMLIVFPIDEQSMSNITFDNLCNLVFNELIAWTVDRLIFFKRTGMTNAFEANVNIGGGNMTRDIIAYMRFVLLRRPWAVFQRAYDDRYVSDIMVPNIDEANVNDQCYVAINNLFNGLIQAAQRNPNPGRQIAATSFRKLLKSMKDSCCNRMIPLIRLLKYNIERIARVYRFFPYTADLVHIIPAFRDERLRVKVPVSGMLSIALGINKAPDSFDWYNLLKFADVIRTKNFAERRSLESIMVHALIRNDVNPARSKKDYIQQNIKPATNVVASLSKLPSATFTTILADRMLNNEIRRTQSYVVTNRIRDAVRAAFEHVPTAEHGIAKGALLLPYPQNFQRSSVYVRKDNILYDSPVGVDRFNLSDLLDGRFYQGLINRVQNMAPFVISGPLQVKPSDASAIESVTSAYLTMSSPYDACVRPEDLRHNRVVHPPTVDYFSDASITRPNTQFEQLMSKTSVFVIDAPRLIVQNDATVYTFDYKDIQLTTSVVDKLEFTSVKTPDVTLFNGMLVYED
ncbi:coreprotein [Rotavirus B]|uniref:Inner capsid protein VP2 n=1 Tax=Rotavirus B TaxID=28876 RepID=A0A1P8DYL0_9REOV|nr:coreprotein [Rotavirus B]